VVVLDRRDWLAWLDRARPDQNCYTAAGRQSERRAGALIGLRSYRSPIPAVRMPAN